MYQKSGQKRSAEKGGLSNYLINEIKGLEYTKKMKQTHGGDRARHRNLLTSFKGIPRYGWLSF